MGGYFKELFIQLHELDEITGREDGLKKVNDLRTKIISNLSVICDENLSKEEMDDAIAFLQSPTGQKLMKVLPEFQESINKSVKSFLERKVEEDMGEMDDKAGDDKATSPKIVGVTMMVTERDPEDSVRITKTGKEIPYNCG